MIVGILERERYSEKMLVDVTTVETIISINNITKRPMKIFKYKVLTPSKVIGAKEFINGNYYISVYEDEKFLIRDIVDFGDTEITDVILYYKLQGEF